ncbi:MAG: hypothetical protein KJ565_13435 [Gammaproteobacteria bacterium]|uniref:hypothetical protein n=1 Tax=Hydrogenophaga sp. TaxID=1904254 RepID=UPI0025BCAD27|nr:hypothetical protein [Hydrogenophaga sp.]MBU4182686.1 hypothetical protein [Gammaproteobacteria bacterium]MBU4280459.1 hypothetical protein [Gammaproteobacteria bacterium]MBU4326095.1 hypothetical protein [Gammaproteobacteria bacterium]MCG2654336.1 hypothetical protein [Hydrogenophaga sp.]
MLVIVETFYSGGESSSAKVRVRPVAGQGFPTSMRVECSRAMRESAPVGARFRLLVKQTSREGGVPFLYSNPNDKWEKVD